MYFKRLSRTELKPLPRQIPVTEEKIPEEKVPEEKISDEVLAVIAAAAYSIVPQGVVTSVRRATAPARTMSAWRLAGLLEGTRSFC